MRGKRIVVVSVAGMLVLGAGVAWATGAIASVVAADGTVYGCYGSSGQLRVVGESESCRANESRIQLLGVTAKAADSDKLDGKDSDAFYAAGTKVADSAHADVADQATNADALDGRDSAEFQARLAGGCPTGSAIRSVGADGTVACEFDDRSTYTGANFALSNQTCADANAVTGIKANGTLRCAGYDTYYFAERTSTELVKLTSASATVVQLAVPPGTYAIDSWAVMQRQATSGQAIGRCSVVRGPSLGANVAYPVTALFEHVGGYWSHEVASVGTVVRSFTSPATLHLVCSQFYDPADALYAVRGFITARVVASLKP